MTGQHSLRVRLAVALLAVTVVAGGVLFTINKVATAGGVPYTAVFRHAGQGLDTSSPVKIRGITVGGVTSVELDGHGNAVLDLHVDPEVRLADTVTASIEPISVFGPKFVNLVPGAHEAAGPYLPGGARIVKTEDPRDLSDTLGAAYGALGAVDPREVTVIVHTLGRGLDGKGEELRGLVDDAGTVLDVAYRHRADARAFLRDAAELSTTLAGSGDDVTGIAADTNAVLPDLTARAGQVRTLLAELDSISGLAAHGLRKHGGDLRITVNAGERAVGIVYRQLGIAGDGVRGITTVLKTLNRLIQAPGPGGRRQLATEGHLLTDPCQTFVGICPGR